MAKSTLDKLLALDNRILKIIGLKSSIYHKQWKKNPPSEEQLQALIEQKTYDLKHWQWADKHRVRCVGTTVAGTRCTRQAEAGNVICATHRDDPRGIKDNSDIGVGTCWEKDRWGRYCKMPTDDNTKICDFHRIEKLETQEWDTW